MTMPAVTPASGPDTAPDARRLRGTLLAVHVVAAVSVLGVDTALLALALAGASGTAPETIYPAMHRLAADLLVPLALAALATGLVQVVVGRWSPLREWWIAVKLAGTLLGTALAALVLTPGLARAADSATGAGAPGFLTGGHERAYAVILAIQCALLVSFAVLGVLKPGHRRRSARSAAP